MNGSYYCSSEKNCPMAAVPLPKEAAQGFGFLCPQCQGEMKPTGGTVEEAWPAGLHPDGMPTHLARPWVNFYKEKHPRVRLNWLTDTAEYVVRWCVGILLPQVRHFNKGQLPDEIVTRVRDHIERPTLGRWLVIYRHLARFEGTQETLTPGLFSLYNSLIDHAFYIAQDSEGKPAEQKSLLQLRNLVAHSGGLSSQRAEALLSTHEPLLLRLLRAVVEAFAGAQLLEIREDAIYRLQGNNPASTHLPSRLEGVTSGTWLIKGDEAISLFPILAFGRVRRIGEDGTLALVGEKRGALIYFRASRDRLEYTPLGTDESQSESLEVQAFRELFGLDRTTVSGEKKTQAEGWDAFLREARILGEDLVGRVDELKRVKDWIKGRDGRGKGPRIGWIQGRPGVGKSLIMMRMATDLGNASPERQWIYYHRFRGGDARNDRRSFLRLLRAALAAWKPLTDQGRLPLDGQSVEELESDVEKILRRVHELPPPAARAPQPRFLILLDGLDEVVARDRELPALIQKLAYPGTVWLLAGRPEHGLQESSESYGWDPIFPGDGLPLLSASDIRSMLFEGLGNARYALLGRDEESGDEISNTFVDRVVDRAQGLPLYIHILLEDLRSGVLTVHDEARLPQGLTAYYHEMTVKQGLSDVDRDRPFLQCLLARAEEPLSEEDLALLMAGGPKRVERYRQRVAAVLRAGRSLLRRAPTASGGEGFTNYHQSFREYIGGRRNDADETLWEIEPAPHLVGTLEEAEERFCELAERWAELPKGNLRNHLFRWGTEYALWWQGAAGVAQAKTLLTRFDYLQARTLALPASEITDLTEEYGKIIRRTESNAERSGLRIWESFFRERAHILRRGDKAWPTNRILLQLAVEHADDSPITRVAERWLDEGHCHWNWLRLANRPKHVAPSALLLVFEGHTDLIIGAREISNNRLASWSLDRTARIWSITSGEQLLAYEEHRDIIVGAIQLDEQWMVSWDRSHTLHIWSLENGTRLSSGQIPEDESRQRNYLEITLGVLEVSSGEEPFFCVLLLGFWNQDTVMPLGSAQFKNESGWAWYFDDPAEIPPGRFFPLTKGGFLLSYDAKNAETHFCVLEPKGRYSRHLPGRCKHSVQSMIELNDGQLVAWGRDGLLQWSPFWHSSLVAPLDQAGEVIINISGALEMEDERLLLWGSDMMQLVSLNTGRILRRFEIGSRTPGGAVNLGKDRFLTWLKSDKGEVDDSETRCLHVWSTDRDQPLFSVEAHGGSVQGAMASDTGGNIYSWGLDGQIKLWSGDFQSGQAVANSRERLSECSFPLSGNRLLSWSQQDFPKVLDKNKLGLLHYLRDEQYAPWLRSPYGIKGVCELSEKRIAVWYYTRRAAPLPFRKGISRLREMDATVISGVAGDWRSKEKWIHHYYGDQADLNR